jgi:hypothetical protein
MSVTLTVNGTDYFYPTTGDVSWGTDATDWAVAVTASMLQKSGGAFTLTAEVDFGATYGLKSAYFKSRTTNPATTGTLRLAKTDSVSFRNNANSGDLALTINGSDELIFNGGAIGGGITALTGDVTASGTGSVSATIAALAVTNSKIANSTIDLTTKVTGALPIANGGTGQTAQTAAFDALAPTTTLGDIIVHNGTDNIRVAGNTTTSTKYLVQTGTGSVSAAPVWAELPTSATSIFVFANIASDVATYYQAVALSSYSAAAVGTIATSVNTSPTLMGSFVTNIGYPNITVIPAGVFTCHYDTQKSAGSNNYYTYAEIYQRTSGGTETLLATTDVSTQTAVNTVVNVTVTALNSSNIALLSTDRIVVKVYGVLLSSSATVTLRFDDSTDARIEFPSTLVDASTFVPYTGATTNLNMGTHTITASNLSGTNTGDNATNSLYTANPMTTAGDLILGGASGTQTRLPIGSNAYVLTSNGTTASWAASAAGFTDPMTTRGDIIIRNAANATARLGIGANTYVLTSDGTDISWAAPGAGSGDMVLASVQTVTGAKTFGTIGGAVGKFILAGSTSGSSILNAAAVAGSTTFTLPTTTGTLIGTGDTGTVTNAMLAGSIDAATKFTGLTPIANGGTNSSATATAGGAGYGTGTAHAYTAAGTAGQVLQSNGSSAPTWVDSAGVSTATLYRTILTGSSSHIAALVAGDYSISNGEATAVSGTGKVYPAAMIRIDAADYPAVNGVTPTMRLKTILEVNNVAPTGNFTMGLYPITRPASSGGAGVLIITMGTVVTSSTCLYTTPAADAQSTVTSADFAIPADGWYCLGVTTTATVAASSLVWLHASLQVKTSAGGVSGTGVQSKTGDFTAVSGYTYLVSSAAARAITLPAAAVGATFTVKDSTGQAFTNNFTITRAAAESIEGVAANKILQTNWGSWTFASDGTNWFIL